MRSVDANSTVDNLVQSAGTVQTVLVKNAMPEANSFWVLYGQHTKPTYLEDAGGGQQSKTVKRPTVYVAFFLFQDC